MGREWLADLAWISTEDRKISSRSDDLKARIYFYGSILERLGGDLGGESDCDSDFSDKKEGSKISKLNRSIKDQNPEIRDDLELFGHTIMELWQIQFGASWTVGDLRKSNKVYRIFEHILLYQSQEFNTRLNDIFDENLGIRWSFLRRYLIDTRLRKQGNPQIYFGPEVIIIWILTVKNDFIAYRLWKVQILCNQRVKRAVSYEVSNEERDYGYKERSFAKREFTNTIRFIQQATVQVSEMSQINAILSKSEGKRVVTATHRMKISVPRFDNTELIKSYARTIIGRCLNPKKQETKALVHLFPQIWNKEEKIAGADLGLGRFQFNFDDEQDIVEVMALEPFHFDGWMVSMVRWEPNMDPNYPFAITFWVKVMGVPLHYWAEQTFMSIGDGLGEAKTVDLDNGRVRVVMNGFRPLVFETVIEFDGGEETVVQLRYERLHGYCRTCGSMCHETDICPTTAKLKMVEDSKDRSDDKDPKGPSDGSGGVSYKGAVTLGRKAAYRETRKESDRQGDSSRNHRGRERAVDYKEQPRTDSTRRESRYDTKTYDRSYGEGSSRGKRGYSPRRKQYKPVQSYREKKTARTHQETFVLNADEIAVLEAFRAKNMVKEDPTARPDGVSENLKVSDKEGNVGKDSGNGDASLVNTNSRGTDVNFQDPSDMVSDFNGELDAFDIQEYQAMDVGKEIQSIGNIDALMELLEPAGDINDGTGGFDNVEEEPELNQNFDQILGDVGEEGELLSDFTNENLNGADFTDMDQGRKGEMKKGQGKKKAGTGNHMLMGRLSKRSMAQILQSPRKKFAQKGAGPGKEIGSGKEAAPGEVKNPKGTTAKEKMVV